ncbi:hypothetical protein [Litchfieldia alkalitelluris]|uniref:hypothetical protein n=1 Tax=Litchfieldia alkalitelluris TaxID=304268 RepID=UPI0009980B63|nr:hypothetical protein [Litchfieldia alkalitelluris]
MSTKVNQAIVEDLLPLYSEGLLSAETTKWVEQQLESNEELKNIANHITSDLPTPEIVSSIDHEKMFKQINRRLSLYQMIFVAISFFLAIQTSLLNESFGFILWYAVLGALTFQFYKDWKLVLFISIMPIFLWSLSSNIMDFTSGSVEGISFLPFLGQSILGSLFLSIFHGLFAILGSIIVWLFLKSKGDS